MVRDVLGLYGRLIGAQLRSQLQYRASFGLDVLATALIVGLEFGSLALVFGRFGDIGGWTLPEVAFLYALVEVAFGVMDMIFSGFDPPNFGQQVRLGRFDQLLLRPAPLLVQVFGSSLDLKRLGRIAVGLGIFMYAVGAADIAWTAAKLAYLPLVLLGMVLFFGGLFVIGATLTFWTVESLEIMNVLTYGGSLMIAYPMHIYERWMRRLFTYALPAIFLNYYPALYFLDKHDPLGFPAFAPFLAPVAGLAVFGAALAFWRYGLRHYQSTGT